MAQIAILERKCIGCGLCVQRCVVNEPEVAIRIVVHDETITEEDTLR